MKAKVKHLRKLLGDLSHKFDEEISYNGLKNISYELGLAESNISIKYLYKYVWQEIRELDDNDTIGLNEKTLNTICEKGFQIKKYRQFIAGFEGKIDEQLVSFAGNYYCYVRMNARTTVVLQSPVRIWEVAKDFFWELKGPSLTYTGKIESRNGCMFILMSSEIGKTIHHIYKVGQRRAPMVLQGVFSGVSTAFDPIGGRVVLVKCEAKYEQMKNKAYKLPDLGREKVYAAKELVKYFRAYEVNNLKIGETLAFDKVDLIG